MISHKKGNHYINQTESTKQETKQENLFTFSTPFRLFISQLVVWETFELFGLNEIWYTFRAKSPRTYPDNQSAYIRISYIFAQHAFSGI